MLTSDEELRIFRTQSIVLCEYVNAIPSIHHDHIFQDDDESEEDNEEDDGGRGARGRTAPRLRKTLARLGNKENRW